MQMTQRFIERTIPCNDCAGTGEMRYLVVFRKMCPCCHGLGRVKPQQGDTFSVHERISQKMASEQLYQEMPPVPLRPVAETTQAIMTQNAAPEVEYNPGLVPPPPPPAIPPARPVMMLNPDEPKLFVHQRRFRLYKQVAPPFHPQHPLKDKLRKNIKLMTEIEGVERTYYLVKE